MSSVLTREMIDDPIDPSGQSEQAGGFNFASLLRWLGCGGVVLSGIVFLLQGFDDIGLALRNWAYLGLMVMLGGVGVGLKYAFEDGKGARLLLGLAVAVIPIQFAQLGGMIHSLVVAAAELDLPASMMSFVEFGNVSWSAVLATGAATAVLASAVGWFGFRVLARPQATALMLVNTLLCATLLIPVREGALAVMVFMALGCVTLLADIRLGRANPILRTSEGRSARLLLVLPLIIAGARASFYLNDIGGMAMLFGVISSTLIVSAYHYVQRSGLRELMLAVGSFGVAAAWSVWSLVELDLTGAQQTLSLFAVQGLLLLGISALSRQGAIYRLFGSLIFGFGALQVLVTGAGLLAPTTALSLGILLAAIGYAKKWRAPAVIGVTLALVAIVPLVVMALGDVEFGTWIGLAIGGVTLVVLASVVERYGRSLAHYAKSSWQEVRAWD